MSTMYRLTTKSWASNLARMAARYIVAATTGAGLMIIGAGVFAAGKLFYQSEYLARSTVRTTITLVGLTVVSSLIVTLLKIRHDDWGIGAIAKRRQPTSTLVVHAKYIEGTERIPVVLSLTGDGLYYENVDLEASFDLHRIDSIEYHDEVASDDCVMRVRSHGATFEFVIARTDAAKWAAALPAMSADHEEGAKLHA